MKILDWYLTLKMAGFAIGAVLSIAVFAFMGAMYLWMWLDKKKSKKGQKK